MIFGAERASTPGIRTVTMHLPDFLLEQDGEVRLSGHRISLFHLLSFYQEGFSAEMLREQFPTLSMALIHKVLGFYWENKAELDALLFRTREQLNAARATGDPLEVVALRARLATTPTVFPTG
jgi:uncharacterized protein (DUF433 family)